MAGPRECNSTVIAGRLSKAVEFFDAAEHLEEPGLRVVGVRDKERNAAPLTKYARTAIVST